MATQVPPLIYIGVALKDTLKNLGIAPIVTANWRISIESDIDIWAYIVTLSWRGYRLRRYIHRDDMESSSTAELFSIGKMFASELYIFNAAEDEEHMEALALLSMRPTNGPQN